MFNGAITKPQFLNLAGFELSLWRDNTSEFMHVCVLAKVVKDDMSSWHHVLRAASHAHGETFARN